MDNEICLACGGPLKDGKDYIEGRCNDCREKGLKANKKIIKQQERMRKGIKKSNLKVIGIKLIIACFLVPLIIQVNLDKPIPYYYLIPLDVLRLGILVGIGCLIVHYRSLKAIGITLIISFALLRPIIKDKLDQPDQPMPYYYDIPLVLGTCAGFGCLLAHYLRRKQSK
ncbi:MAG: hypothetical protein C0403_01010 [Desulfobacterium sp.]|nr:hypothetical protein [Desulfobacterium sp.]